MAGSCCCSCCYYSEVVSVVVIIPAIICCTELGKATVSRRVGLMFSILRWPLQYLLMRIVAVAKDCHTIAAVWQLIQQF